MITNSLLKKCSHLPKLFVIGFIIQKALLNINRRILSLSYKNVMSVANRKSILEVLLPLVLRETSFFFLQNVILLVK